MTDYHSGTFWAYIHPPKPLKMLILEFLLIQTEIHKDFDYRIPNIKLPLMNFLLNNIFYWYSKLWAGAYDRFEDLQEPMHNKKCY